MSLTPAALFAYANEYARAAEADGKGTAYPTIREAVKKFRVTQQAVEDACGDYSGPGYLGIIIGFRTSTGSGTYARGDRQIEAYKD